MVHAEAEGAMQRVEDVGHGDERMGYVWLRGEHDDGVWQETGGDVEAGEGWCCRLNWMAGSSEHCRSGWIDISVVWHWSPWSWMGGRGMVC